MLVFASSDKGGTGRSVTSCNLAYRLSLLGLDVVYLDFDFASPTAGAIFEIPSLARGARTGGLHSYLREKSSDLAHVDVLQATERRDLKKPAPGAGRLFLIPGDLGGHDFPLEAWHFERTASLFRDMEREYDVCVVDLSSGRSQAVDLSLRAIASNTLRGADTVIRWLVFHRWTRQHLFAASGLIFDDRGIVDIAVDAGHDRTTFQNMVRSIRTAVPDLRMEGVTARPEQAQWIRWCNDELRILARDTGLGQSRTLGATPLEPVLVWREQVIMDSDVTRMVANRATAEAFRELAWKLTDDEAWDGV